MRPRTDDSETRPGSSIRAGVRAGMPLVLPLVVIAVSFGVLARPVMGQIAPVAMSVFVFAGAAQFGSLSVISAGGTAAAAIATGVLLNARFLPMGFAAGSSFTGSRIARAAQGQTVVDASWAIASRGDGTFDRGLLIGATIPQAVSWVGGTVVGVLIGASIDPDRFGLGAIFPAFYLALLVGELRSERSRIAALLSALVALALIPFAPAGIPVVAASAVALIGLRSP